jgi:hypothetical protein
LAIETEKYVTVPSTTYTEATYAKLNQKADVGLGNVDNTSDSNKPVSTAQQTALNLKANLASPALTGTPTAPTAPAGTNTTQIATTAWVNSSLNNQSNSSYTISGGTITQYCNYFGPILICVGTYKRTTAASIQDTITFPKAFSNNLYGLSLSFGKDSASWQPNQYPAVINARSATGFTIRHSDGQSGSFYSWIAIGQA